MKFKVQVDGQEKELVVTRQGTTLQVIIDGNPTELQLLYTDGPYFVLEYADGPLRRRLRAAGHANGERRQLWVNGTLLSYERLRERGGAAGPEVGSLSATIPAVVSEILVKVGDDVTAGQKLILLESMKMILPIQAPHPGRITQINCTIGQAVQPGRPLLVMSDE